MIVFAASGVGAQDIQLDLPRPGAVVVADVTGEGFIAGEAQRKALKADDRVRVGAVVATGRRSMLTLQFSNGASVRLGSDTELEIEEFGQQPSASAPKFADLKTEPTLSRTRLKLVKGDIAVEVKPLRVARGSAFLVVTPAGAVRTGEGAFRAMASMSDYGLGVCTLELQKGAAEIELPGTAFSPVPVGSKLAFALERDRATGAIKVGEMPKPKPAGATAK
ncbi:MAG: FecR domain-containing protein [Elusimicrobiota bacterium]